MTDAARKTRGHLHLEIREGMPLWQQSLVVAGGGALGLLISVIILVVSGVGLSDLVNEFVFAIFSNPKSISAVLVQAAPLVIVGLSAAIAFKARFWNIGIEGQVIFGAFGATLIAIYDVGPESTRLVFMALAAALGGALWMALPVFLKIRLQVNEIISTLLMNYIAANMLLHLLYGPWQDPVSSFPHSEKFEQVERFSPLGWQSINFSLIIALVLVAVLFWLLLISRFGYLLNFVQQNTSMAKAIGIRVTLVVAASALISGALSGVAGFVLTAGIETRMTQSFFVGFGFSGILIAFLARNNPIGVVFVALLVATLIIAGQSLQVFYQIPFAMVQLIQAVIFITVAASEFLVRHRIRWIT
jgi:ABC-type uncharacterized transport system permease subunit